MTNTADVVSVGGSFITQSTVSHNGYLTAGTLEVGGNLQQIYGSYYSFYTSGTHTTLLKGSTAQTVNIANSDPSYSHFNNLKIENTSETGVTFSTTVYVIGQLYNTESKLSNLSNLYTYTNTTFPDNEWDSNLYLRNNAKLPADFTIDGNLYISTNLTLSGDLHITGDLYLQSGTLTINGHNLTVDGDFNFSGTSGNVSNGYFKMTNANDVVFVGGDFDVYTYTDNRNYLTAGILEIKGNISQRDYSNGYSYTEYGFHATGTHKTILSGNSLQTVSFANIESQFNTVQISNTSEDGVIFATAITRNELIIDEGAKLTLPDGERTGWTLSNDETIEGNLTLNSGTLDLNGFTLTITGNLIQSGGTVKVNGGILTVEGDYRIQTFKNNAYTNSAGILNMTNTADVVSVGGSFITQSTVSHNGYLTAGTLEVGGNLQQIYGSYYSFYTSGTHTTLLKGSTAQTVNIANSDSSYSHFNNLKIENTSETGVTFSTTVYVIGQLYNTESKLSNLSNLYTYTNTTFPDNEWDSDLYLRNNAKLPADFTIDGNLYISTNLTLSGDLHITGDLYLQSGTLTINGHNLTVDGDFQYKNSSSYSSGYFVMTNANDYVLVGGDFYVYSRRSNSGNMTAGILEIKGNVTQTYSTSYTDGRYGFHATGTHKTILSGNSLQTVSFANIESQFNTVQISNTSEDGVIFATAITRNELIIDEGAKLTLPDGERTGWTLSNDETIEGNLTLNSGTLDLNGFTLTITGNLIQSGGTVKVNGGKLTIQGDYRIQTFKNNAYTNSAGILNMTNTADVVSVSGSFITQSTVSHQNYLTAGTLEVGGNLQQIYGSYYSFYTSGTHTTILKGSTAQTVNIANSNASYSHFNNLKIDNTSEIGVTFSTIIYIVNELYNSESNLNNVSNVYITSNTIFPDGVWNNNLYLNANYTLSGDLHITGDLYLQSGTLTINGQNLSIGGDFQYGTSSSGSSGYFKMTNSNDYVLVNGNCYVYSYYGNRNNLTAGVLEIKGNITQRDYSNGYSDTEYGFHATGTHKTILSGNSLQTVSFANIESQFNTVQISNTSEDGVIFATAITRNELIIDEGAKLTLPDGERTGWTLSNDETIEGNLTLNSGTLDLNGFTLTITGNLIQSGGTVKVNGGILTVQGDYRIQTFKNNAYTNSAGILNMTNTADVVSVGGSFITQSTVSHNGYLTAGTLEVGGNLQQIYGSYYSFYTSGTHTTLLKGSTAQTVNIANSDPSYSHFNNLKIENTSETGVTFSTTVYVIGQLYNTESKLSNLSNLYTYTNTSFPDANWDHDLYLNYATKLPADFTIDGSLYLSNNITLSGDLHITGDLYLQSGTLTINGHNLTIDGDFNYKKNNGNPSTGYFKMTNANDVVFVGGDFDVYTYLDNRDYLTAGLLEIKGNISQRDYSNGYNYTEYGFHATGTHKTILSGNSLQTVSFANIESQFNTLEITKDFNLGYTFSRTPMWVTLVDSSTDKTAPEAPRQLQFVRSTATSIYLSWTVPADNIDVAGYRIYRDGANVGETIDSSYIDNGLTSDETYGYYITAYDFSGNESIFSNAILATSGTDLFAPTEPMNLSAKSKSESTITLTWVGSSDNASVEGYNIYRDDVIIGSVKGTTFTDQNAPGGLYTYYVRAFDNENNLSVASTAVSIDNMLPSKPILTVDKVTDMFIGLSWVSTDNDKVVSYELYKNGVRYKTLNSPSFIDTAVEIDTSYTYYVIAYDPYGNASDRSESMQLYTGEDDTAPTINSIVISNNNKTAIITVSANDNRALSSVTAQYSNDKVNWTELPIALTEGKASEIAKFAFDFSELTDGTWYVRAAATDSSGNVSDSEASPIAEFTVDNTAPHTPFELSSNVANGSIYIAWNYDTTDTDIEYFRVYRMKGDNGEYILLKDNYKYTSIYDNNFEVGYEYGYRITAVDTSGNESPYSATKRATVENDEVAPNVLSIYPKTGTKISSDFDMSVACFDNIKLKTLTVSVKRTDSDTWQTLSETELDTYHKVTDIEIDTSGFTTGQYEFKAIVIDAYGNESTAKSVVYDYKSNTLSVPALTAVGAGWRSELSWTMTNTEDIVGYYIYRRGLTETSFRQIAGVNRTSYTDNNVNAGEKYFYQIEAIDSYGNKKTSESVSVIPTHEDEIKPTAYAGSDLLAIAGESVTFDGSRSGDNNYVQSYHWDFGDGSTSSSAKASHTYDSEGTYTATLTVTDSSSNSAADTVTVTVYGTENDSFTVKTVSDNGMKLPNVNIICDEILGAGASCFTNSNGQYTFIAPSGTYTLYLYADDYLPIKQTVNSNEDTTVTLVKKQVADGKLTVTELDYNEIVALGIDPTDTANRYVFKYTIDVKYTEGSNGYRLDIFRNAEGDLITGNSGSGFNDMYSLNGVKIWEFHNNKLIYDYGSSGGSGGGSGGGGGGSGGGGGGGSDGFIIKGITLVTRMRITTDLTWLKGFYNVELTIINNADEDFYIDHSLANIILPEGLSLADTTDANGVTKLLGKIAGGETKVISWTVRGDKPGSYDISAQFTGSLEPFGVPIEMEFDADNPIVVEAGNALYFEVVHEMWSKYNDIWTIDYKLTNVGETTVNDIQFEILADHIIKSEIDIQTMYIYHNDREGYDEVNWVDGKPDFENVKRWFNPLTEDIPDTTINLDPGEYLEFTVEVTKESQ